MRTVYRFVLSARWLGLGLLMTLAAATMVGLGFWQLSRYQYRSEINNRIDTASNIAPAPVGNVLGAPGPGRRVGAAPEFAKTWTRVTATGVYDSAHEVMARARTVNANVGFEIITPLVLADGTAVLVDRGWIASGDGGATVAPVVPPAPSGQVTVVGRVHAPESKPSTPENFDGHPAVRRIGPAELADSVPYPLYGGYITLEQQTPPASAAFVPIPPDYEDATMNAGYVIQWWAFALLTLGGYVYLVMKEARGERGDFDPYQALLDDEAARSRDASPAV